MSSTTCSRRTARTRFFDIDEYDAFRDWCDGRLEMSTESYNDWMNDHDGGERFHAERKIDDFFSSGRFCEDAQPAQQVRAAASAPPPPPPPAGSPVATQEPEDWLALHPLANYSSQLGDWQPSGGDHNAWGSLPEPDDEEPAEQQAAQATDEPTNEPSALKPAHVPTPRAMFFHCGSFTTEEPESVPPAEPRPLPSARAAFYHQSSFTAEQRLNAHTASMPPGEAASAPSPCLARAVVASFRVQSIFSLSLSYVLLAKWENSLSLSRLVSALQPAVRDDIVRKRRKRCQKQRVSATSLTGRDAPLGGGELPERCCWHLFATGRHYLSRLHRVRDCCCKGRSSARALTPQKTSKRNPRLFTQPHVYRPR